MIVMYHCNDRSHSNTQPFCLVPINQLEWVEIALAPLDILALTSKQAGLAIAEEMTLDATDIRPMSITYD